MSMRETNGIHDPSSDDGELTDESGTERRSRGIEFYRDSSKTKDEEDKLRRNLLAKHSSKSFAHSSDDDEQEMFTMQPGDSNTSRLAHRLEKAEKSRAERDKKDREHRDRHERHQKHKHERRERDRDRHSERHDRDRSERSKHDERESRERERHDEHRHKLKTDEKKPVKPSPHTHDRAEKHKLDRLRENDRDKKDENSRDRSARKHARSSTGSSSPETERKKERKECLEPIEEKKSDSKIPKVENTKPDSLREVSVEQDDEVSEVEKPTNVEQLQADFDESDEEDKIEITSFVLDCPTGPKKYSKFDSSPEPDDYPSPARSEVGLAYSDEEEEQVAPVLDFDPKTARFEDLSDDQKGRLSPDSRQRLESDHQRRLVAALPVYYPGIMGCRNVQEYECVNRVQEGTFGVVFRAKEKRTDEIVALKRLKMEKEREGFPITSLREINMLLKAGSHENIVNIKEILIGSSMDKIYVAMEFVEHDLKSFMDIMSKRGKRFSIGEQKTLMKQLLSGLAHMHHLWILHRDLKTSNLLLSHKGVLKIADFGLAREYGDPLNAYTPIVVTLWYRSPELLLGKKIYSTPVDMWSVGCIMAEFQSLKALFPGRIEMDQLRLIYQQMGTPSKEIWPEYEELPLVKQLVFDKYPFMQLRKKFPPAAMSDSGFKLLTQLLTYDPDHRITADDALDHPWFSEDPKPVTTDMFPTFPAKSEQHKDPPQIVRKRKIPVVDENTAKLLAEFKVRPDQVKATGFSLKFDKTKF